MAEAQITLRDVWDEVRCARGDMSEMKASLAAHIASTTERLDSGQRKMTSLDERLRDVEARLPDNLAERLTALERRGWRQSGAVALLSGVGGAIAGGGTIELVIWLASGH